MASLAYRVKVGIGQQGQWTAILTKAVSQWSHDAANTFGALHDIGQRDRSDSAMVFRGKFIVTTSSSSPNALQAGYRGLEHRYAEL